MLKAHELMARHHITTLESDPERTFASIFLGQPALRHFKEAYVLAHLIQDFYFVQGIWVPAFVVAKGKMGRVLEISGTPANTAQAGYVFDFVQGHIDRRWRKMTTAQRLTRYQKSDFAVGVIEGLRHKLEQPQRAPGKSSDRELIRKSDPRLSAYFSRRYPHTRRIQRGGGHRDEDLYHHGRKVGQTMILHRGIAHTSPPAGKRLPPI